MHVFVALHALCIAWCSTYIALTKAGSGGQWLRMLTGLPQKGLFTATSIQRCDNNNVGRATCMPCLDEQERELLHYTDFALHAIPCTWSRQSQIGWPVVAYANRAPPERTFHGHANLECTYSHVHSAAYKPSLRMQCVGNGNKLRINGSTSVYSRQIWMLSGGQATWCIEVPYGKTLFMQTMYIHSGMYKLISA
jgi:hypothetical protein